jgi:hypothetical protein
MQKITLKIFEGVDTDVAFNFVRESVADFNKNGWKNCVYTRSKAQITCFVKKTKANNLVVGVWSENNNKVNDKEINI